MKRKIRLRTRIGKKKEESDRLELQCPASCPSGLRDRKLNPGIKANSDFDRISAVFLPPLSPSIAGSHLSLTSLSTFHWWWAVYQNPWMETFVWTASHSHFGSWTMPVSSNFPHQILNTCPILLPVNIHIPGGWKRDCYVLWPWVIRIRWVRWIPNWERKCRNTKRGSHEPNLSSQIIPWNEPRNESDWKISWENAPCLATRQQSQKQ